MPELDSVIEGVGVLLISLVSGYAAKLIHNTWHQIYGTDTISILAVTGILAGVAGIGYYTWTVLTEVEYSKPILGITVATTGLVHYLSHGVLPSFEAVGGVVFLLFTLGTAANYVLRPNGIEL